MASGKEELSVVASTLAGESKPDALPGSDAPSNTATGAVTGGLVGGAAGVVLSMAALAIPGLGPVVAAGPLLAGLTGASAGAVAGGVIGALTDEGIPEEHAMYYAEAVRRGGALVTVRADDVRADRAAEILRAQRRHRHRRARLALARQRLDGLGWLRAPLHGRGSGKRAPPVRDAR